MRVKSPPVPVGDPNHYAMVFPLRPCPSAQEAAQDKNCGETRFQVSYQLPYSGSLVIAPKVAVPTGALVVMLPKSMTFKPGASAPYAAVTEPMAAQAFVAQQVQPSEPLEFTLSGSGQLPRDSDTGPGQSAGAGDGSSGAGAGSGDLTPSEASARQRADTKPGVGLNNPLDSDGDLEPWAKYKWWILGLLGLALAGGAGVMLKAAPAGAAAVGLPVAVAGPVAPAGSDSLLQALKDELFALETDRLAGRLSEAQYAEQKGALEVVLRRAMARTGADSGKG